MNMNQRPKHVLLHNNLKKLGNNNNGITKYYINIHNRTQNKYQQPIMNNVPLYFVRKCINLPTLQNLESKTYNLSNF